MSLKTVEMFTVVCDECGADFFADDPSEYAAWSDQDGALEMFREAMGDACWSEFEDMHRCSKHNPFCTQCGRDAGEFSGERDYLCPICWAESLAS